MSELQGDSFKAFSGLLSEPEGPLFSRAACHQPQDHVPGKPRGDQHIFSLIRE